MNNVSVLVLMFIAGALLGAVYLAGLWWSIRHIHTQRTPALWLIVSLVVRLALVTVALYFILGEQHWERLLAALAGFITVRALTIRRIRRRLPTPHSQKERPI